MYEFPAPPPLPLSLSLSLSLSRGRSQPLGHVYIIIHFHDNNNNIQPFLMFCKSLFFSKYNVAFIDINISPNVYVGGGDTHLLTYFD